MKEQEIVKHWVKNALNKVFLILLTISNISFVNSQNISGKYYGSSGNNVSDKSYIHFKDNGEFKYYVNSGGHTISLSEGSGHYFVQDKEMILKFDLTEISEEGFFFKDSVRINFSLTKTNQKSQYRIETKETPKDSVTIEFEIIDKFVKRPLGGGLLAYGNKKGEFVVTDKYGKASLKLPKTNKNMIFTHNYVSYPVRKIPINTLTDSFIKFEFNTEEGVPIKNEVWKFKIKKCSDGVLILKDKHGKKQKWTKAIE